MSSFQVKTQRFRKQQAENAEWESSFNAWEQVSEALTLGSVLGLGLGR